MKPIVITFAGITIAFATIGAAYSDDSMNQLERAAKEMPRSALEIPSQWFEMESIIGWEKMMLVFGYADNRDVCKRILAMAVNEGSGRDFRCTPAN